MAPFKRRRILGRSFAVPASSREQKEKALARAPGRQTAPSPGDARANTHSPASSRLFSSTHPESGHQAALFFVFSTLARFGTIPTPQRNLASPSQKTGKPPRRIRDPHLTKNPRPHPAEF